MSTQDSSAQHPPVQHRPVLVVDCGAQYAQLIARRVREARLYSEIVPHSMSAADMLAKNPVAIILSGGPSSVYEDGAPQVDSSIYDTGVPVFGICYGFQLMAKALGGTVAKTGLREYGRTTARIADAGATLAGAVQPLTALVVFRSTHPAASEHRYRSTVPA